MTSNLKEFTAVPARPLPVVLLADVSGSMSVNGKIDALNGAVAEMLQTFAAEDDGPAEIQVAVITFGRTGARLHQPLTPASKMTWKPMAADGGTPLGEALDLVASMIADRSQLPRNACWPTLILVSDGQPTDSWEEPLKRLLSSERGSKAPRFAMGIGDDADAAMLSAFLADPKGQVFRANEARQIKQFFRWVTMTVTTRSRSVNPNAAVAIAPTALEELDF